MNKLIIDSKIEIVEINKKEDTFFINGFLAEEKQKIKFIFKTKDENKVFEFENLDKDKKYRAIGNIFVKYKKFIYVSVNIQSIEDMNGNVLIAH